MDEQQFNSYWETWYPDCQPVPHWLRDCYANRWLRIHTLPQSKRYPDNNLDYEIILSRHNAVLGELANRDEKLALLSTNYSENPAPSLGDTKLGNKDAGRCWRTIPMHDEADEEHPNYWHIHISLHSWLPHTFDSILRLVANNTVANVMLLSTENHWIYHPYDGGGDIIVVSEKQQQQLHDRFRHWLSSRDDGL